MNRDFDQLVADFLAGYWEANPSSATAYGIHEHDSVLDSMTRDAIEAESARLQSFRDRLEFRISPAQLDRDRRIDRSILLTQIDAIILELTEIRSWTKDPGLYVELLGNSLLSLLKRDFAPLESRVRSLLARLEQVPRLMDEARSNLERPPRLFLQTALRLIPGTVEFLKHDLLRPLASARAELRGRAEALAAMAADALIDYGRHVEGKLLPLSEGDYRLGPDLYRKKFRVALATDLEPERLLSRAREALRETREEMAALARRMDPGRSLSDVLNRAARDHPTPERFLQEFRESVEAVKDFIRSRDLIALPDPDSLVIEAAPPFFAIQGAFCDSPGPFDVPLPTYYYVSELSGFSTAEAEDLLQDNNDYLIPIVTIHEAYPGHYVHFVHQNRSPSVVRKVFWNGAFVEGWAHYAEQMMIEEGFGAAEPRIRLFLLKNQTRAQLNAILDILLHTGEISEEGAVNLLKEEGWQPDIVARKKVERAGLTSTQLSTYYLGRSEILDLRERYRTRLGGRYALKKFHEALMEIGSPPFPVARDLLLEESA